KPTRHHFDKRILPCNPQPATCASTTPTTTTLPPCGNGVIDPGEQCDPAASSSGCPSGQGCNTQCQCVQVSCDPIVPGEPIANTYQLSGAAGPQLCTALPTTNPLGARAPAACRPRGRRRGGGQLLNPADRRQRGRQDGRHERSRPGLHLRDGR